MSERVSKCVAVLHFYTILHIISVKIDNRKRKHPYTNTHITMGNKTSKTNKEFQAVIPYTPSSSRTHPKRKKATQPRRPTVAPALKKENSGISTDSTEDQDSLGIVNNQRRIPLRSPSIGEDVGWTPQNSNFDFSNTEGQNRRELIATCDSECSLITPFLYVGSFTVASSKEILNQNKITRIVNCSLCAVDNVFESDPAFTYLSLNMLDGRQDDISWFLCHVINFIEIARKEKCNVLVHCEKGISRSCSFAIAYIMWASGSVIFNLMFVEVHMFPVVCKSCILQLIPQFLFNFMNQVVNGRWHLIMFEKDVKVVLLTQDLHAI